MALWPWAVVMMGQEDHISCRDDVDHGVIVAVESDLHVQAKARCLPNVNLRQSPVEQP